MKPTKPLFSLAAVLASLALACGCGGGGDSSSVASVPGSSGSASATGAAGADDSTSTSAANQSDSNGEPAKSGGPERSGSESGKPGDGGSKDAEPHKSGSSFKSSEGPAPTDPKPLPNEGTSAVAPQVPTVKGGDNSIQEYGVEATSAERIRTSSSVGEYLSAVAAGEWDAACAYLWAPLQGRLGSFGENNSRVSKGCGGGLEALLSKRPQADRESAAEIDVLSMRVQGQHAFVIYRDGSGKPFNLPLVAESGEWKLNSPAGIGLVL